MDILGAIGTFLCMAGLIYWVISERREAIETRCELDRVRKLHAELDAMRDARQQRGEEKER